MKKRTLDFIKELSCDAKPVKPLLNPKRQWLYWLLLCIVVLGVVFSRYPVVNAPREVLCHYSVELVLLIWGWLWGSYAVLNLSVPCEKKRPTCYAPLIPFLIFLIYTTWRYVSAMGAGTVGSHMPLFHCVQTMVAVAFVPMAVLCVMARRAAPFRNRFTGLLIAISTAALGILVLRFTCPLSHMGFIVINQIIPLFAIGAVGFWGISQLLRD